MIIDPANPPAIFDGQLPVYSTCRDCNTIMKVVDPRDKSHPCCTTIQTVTESLADLYLSELNSNDHAAAEQTAQLMTEVATLNLGEAAVTFAEWGWPVFPLGKRSKAPAIPKDKGGKGFKDATSDVKRIEKWWTRHPDHNIGLATGHLFDVIDIDTKEADKVTPTTAGVMSFLNLLTHNKIPECHGVAVTASGGIHLYVTPTGKGNYAGLRPSIDYRGKGGYVVAPPSLLRKPGQTYTWLAEPSPIIKGDF